LDIRRHTVLRDWVALVLILVVVPVSVFGGTNVSCVGQGISQVCAPQAVFVSPALLLLAGLVAGLITSGWTGLFVVGVGQIAGQVIIVAMAYLAGRPVPIDLFSGIVATIWFGVPIAVGYGIARAGAWIWRGLQKSDDDVAAAPEAPKPPEA
jgi:hypothetical protein